MSLSPISNLSNSYLESLLASTSTNNLGSTAALSTTQSDSGQLSPFSQLLSTLQQLQQSNPTEYAQVTEQISTNLQSAAQTATADGNSTAASQLNQLATDFNNASTSGQLPNIQDLAQAIGGGGHHHHHHHFDSSSSSSTGSDSSSSTSSTSSTSSSTTSATNQILNELLSAFEANGGQSNESLNPMSIISNTLTSAGITIGSNG